MYAVCFFVALFACVIGKICGMGGGVIIKPVLDALGIMSVAAINLVSGCTVIAMSCWSVGSSLVRRQSEIDWKISTPLAIGAAVGGILGKTLFSAVAGLFADKNAAGGVQAMLLFAATLATLIYTIRKDRIPSRHVTAAPACALIGLLLGMLGAFLGIGGGPFNMAVLFYFFSMKTKVAAQNSLYVILISQITGLASQFLSGSVPAVSIPLLLGMAFFGVLGSEIGGRLNKKLSEKRATVLFEGAMVLVMLICVYNVQKLF